MHGRNLTERKQEAWLARKNMAFSAASHSAYRTHRYKLGNEMRRGHVGLVMVFRIAMCAASNDTARAFRMLKPRLQEVAIAFPFAHSLISLLSRRASLGSQSPCCYSRQRSSSSDRTEVVSRRDSCAILPSISSRTLCSSATLHHVPVLLRLLHASCIN